MENVGAQFLSLQHVLDRAFCKRELLWIAGAQYHIRAGPVLRIEERIAPDRDRRLGLGDLAESHPDVAFVRIRAHRFREQISVPFNMPVNPRQELVDGWFCEHAGPANM